MVQRHFLCYTIILFHQIKENRDKIWALYIGLDHCESKPAVYILAVLLFTSVSSILCFHKSINYCFCEGFLELVFNFYYKKTTCFLLVLQETTRQQIIFTFAKVVVFHLLFVCMWLSTRKKTPIFTEFVWRGVACTNEDPDTFWSSSVWCNVKNIVFLHWIWRRFALCQCISSLQCINEIQPPRWGAAWWSRDYTAVILMMEGFIEPK